jgi:hypothetical protein
MTLTKKVLLLGVLIGLASLGSARADTLYNNLGATGTGADPVGSDWGPLADSFSTGSSPFDFTSLTVILSGTPSSGTTTAYLLSDSSTNPGSILETIGTFDEASLTSGPGLFTLNTSYVLSPDTRYWIELTSDDNNANWQWSLDTSGPGVAGEFVGSFQGSGSWQVFSSANGPYQMEVTGTQVSRVPEPSTLLLLVAGLAALLWFTARHNQGVRNRLSASS